MRTENLCGHGVRNIKAVRHGLNLSRGRCQEFFYLCDTKRHVFAKTTLDGKELWRKWAPEQCYTMPDEFVRTNIAVAPGGNFYVADGYGKSFIHEYDHDAKYLRSFRCARATRPARPIVRMA